ncbi:MAG: Rrf2 family transcriptional regulator [Clostridia bacterium]|nr:Rrf2 family transcriptional regulator [Clostridia bacterium]
MISTKGRYALRVLLDLAQHSQMDYVPLKDIAQRQGISKKYLEAIVKELVAGQLLQGVSGKGGGYRLCRAPQDYTLGEILELTEGPLSSVACLVQGAEPCPRAHECQTLPVWAEFDRMTHDFFYSKRLSDLMGSDAAQARAEAEDAPKTEG